MVLSLTYKVVTPPNLHNNIIFITSSPISVLAALALHLLLPLLGHQHHPCSFRWLWNQLPIFFHQPHTGTSFSIPDLSLPTFDSPLCSSITFPLTFTLGLILTCFTKSFPVVSLFHRPALIHGLSSRQFLLSHPVFCYL